MPRRATPLSAAKVRTAMPGRYCDGDGLYLLVRAPEMAFWVFRYVRGGRMREMGLGRARGPNSVPLAEARVKAAPLRRLVQSGVDPLAQRDVDAAAARAAAQTEKARAITFRAVARFYLDAHEAKWRNAKHRQQWQNTLDTYAMPHLGDLPVGDVGTAHVLTALEPIWRAKPETASRVRGRIESVLSYAKTREWRSGENPARWRGHLSNLLPARAKVAPVEHHPALPWREIGSFMIELQRQRGIGARALEFTVLTAARAGEVIGATWAEIDMQVGIWVIPGGRMKGGREHRVPLSAPALALLGEMANLRATESRDGHVFFGIKPGRSLNDTALFLTLRRMGRADLTAHGFRSTFRDWVAEATGYPREVAEAALAHMSGDKTEAAYQRGDLFEKRRRLMEEWAEFCARPPMPAGEVLVLRRA